MSADQSTITYRDIPGHPGYRVGDDGSVWSSLVNRGQGTYTPGGPWRQLRPIPSKSGHLSIEIRGKRHGVHRLVLTAFVGPCPDEMEACHFPDRDPRNNHLSNLRWGTSRENRADSRIHGTMQLGSRSHQAKLTEDQVRMIRDLPATVTSPTVAKRFGMSPSHIRKIRSGGAWRHLEVGSGARSTLPRGEQHAAAVLNVEKVKAIRIEYATGTVTMEQLAAKYNVGHTTICNVITRSSWKHVV